MIDQITKLDEALSRYLIIPEENAFLRKFASFLAHSGDSWFIEIGLFLIWLFTKGPWHTYSAYFAGSIIIQALVVLAIKFLIKRKRPEGEWGSVYRNTDPHSFPSGHAARAIMLSVIAFGLDLTSLGWFILVWGICISFARVGLGVHYLVDIIVGWIIGILLGKVMLILQPYFFHIFSFVF